MTSSQNDPQSDRRPLIIAFDLDDTLYDERSYVESGLRAVADYGARQYGLEAEAAFTFMRDVLDAQGRGAIFDAWLGHHGLLTRARVRDCLRIYRGHRPTLHLNAAAQALLPRLAAHPLYLVTDGNKLVQHRKVQALAIAPLFRKVFITHRHGIKHAKPSPYCFERILERENADWPDLVYIGDNPAKDFVSLNAKGAKTVRVLTGVHRDAQAASGYEAQHRLPDLAGFPGLLPRLTA